MTQLKATERVREVDMESENEEKRNPLLADRMHFSALLWLHGYRMYCTVHAAYKDPSSWGKEQD